MEIFRSHKFWGNLIFFSADGAFVVFWKTGAGMNFLQEFLPGIYTAAIIFCTGAIVALNWQWYQSRKPKTRFRQLESLLHSIAFYPGDSPTYDMAKIRELHFALKDIGIEYPLEGIDSKLRRYVTKDLWAACRNGKLDYARTSWKRRGEPTDNQN